MASDAKEAANFVKLCQLGKMEAIVKQQLSSFVSSVYKDFTPLIAAAKAGQLETVKLLLDNGADVNWANRKGQNALFFAIQKNEVEVVKILLHRGADIEQMCLKDNSTVLIAAVKKNYVKTVELLLSHQANIQHVTRSGFSPLMTAAKYASSWMVELLLGYYSGNIDGKDMNEWTPMWHAIYQEHTESVKLLLEAGANVNYVNSRGESGLRLALTLRKMDIAKLLLHYGADVNHVDTEGNTLLMKMSHDNNHEGASLLIENGAHLNHNNVKGWTSVMLAAQSGHVEMVQLLLSNSANIHSSSLNGYDALMLASLNSHADVIDVLLSHGADANRSNLAYWTPLMLASQKPNTLACLKLLVEKGNAEVSYENIYGWDALKIATFYGHCDIVAYLCLKKAKIHLNEKTLSPLILAALLGHLNIIHLLITNGAKVDQVNSEGLTALMYAAQVGNTDVVTHLINSGASVTLADQNGLTPIEHALKHEHKAVLNILLRQIEDSLGKADCDGKGGNSEPSKKDQTDGSKNEQQAKLTSVNNSLEVSDLNLDERYNSNEFISSYFENFVSEVLSGCSSKTLPGSDQNIKQIGDDSQMAVELFKKINQSCEGDRLLHILQSGQFSKDPLVILFKHLLPHIQPVTIVNLNVNRVKNITVPDGSNSGGSSEPRVLSGQQCNINVNVKYVKNLAVDKSVIHDSTEI